MKPIPVLLLTLAIADVDANPQPARQPTRRPAPAATEGSRCVDMERRRAQAGEFLNAGANDDAIQAYEALLRDCPSHARLKIALRFNIGLAYKNRGERPIDAVDPREALRLRSQAIADRQRALALFREFLAARPSAQLIPEAKAYVARLEADLLEQTLLATSERDRIDAETARERQLVAEVARVARYRRQDARRRHRLRIASYSSFTVSAAGLGVGIYYGLQARTLSSQLSQVTDWTAVQARQVDEGVTAEMRATILSAAGGAALVAGAVLLWLSREQPLFLAPSLTTSDDAASLSLSGAF